MCGLPNPCEHRADWNEDLRLVGANLNLWFDTPQNTMCHTDLGAELEFHLEVTSNSAKQTMQSLFFRRITSSLLNSVHCNSNFFTWTPSRMFFRHDLWSTVT